MFLIIAFDVRTAVDEFSLPMHHCMQKCHHILLILFFAPDYLEYLRSRLFSIIDTMVKIKAVKA
jgi:hypothetical protein